MSELEVQISGRPRFRVPIPEHGEFVVGRGSEAALQINEPYISSRHTALAIKLEVRDLGSTNGTLVRGDKVDTAHVDPGEPFLVGGPEGARLTLFLAGKPPDSTVSFGKKNQTAQRLQEVEAELASQKQLNQSLDAHVAALEAELAEARAAIEAAAGPSGTGESPDAPRDEASAAPGGSGKRRTQDRSRGGTVHLARIGELQEKLTREQKARQDAEAQVQVLSKKGFSGAQEAVGLVQERDRIIKRLQQELEGQRKQVATGGVGGGADAVAIATHLIDTLSNTGGLNLEDALHEMVSQRTEVFDDLGFLVGALYRFSRDLEVVITRMAQLYRGGINTADDTMIPGITANLSRSVHALLLRGGERPRNDLQEYLESLRVWSGICLTAYKSGARQWCRETIERISPATIQRASQVPAWKRALGLDGWEFWRTYRKQMENITVDIAEAQIDDLAANQAVELAKKQGVY